MNVDLLIIGQGICGSFLHWYAQRAGLSVMLIDEPRANTASKMAAGIINPVTGRRIVTTWMIRELLAHAQEAFAETGVFYNQNFLSRRNIIDFFPTPQMLLAYQSRRAEDPQFLGPVSNNLEFDPWFFSDFGNGEINPAFLVDVTGFLASVRTHLKKNGILREDLFHPDELTVSDSAITYRDIHSSHIIFCDGISGFQNPWFKHLPFALNKGEALIIECRDLPDTHIFKKGINIVPWKENLFWVGSSYQWEFDNEAPTEAFSKQTEATLQRWLKIPFKTVAHFSSVRPATIERRPFVGFHPLKKNIGILNGMGTKGCSLAPFFASQLVDHICLGTAIHREADITRFSRILGRN